MSEWHYGVKNQFYTVVCRESKKITKTGGAYAFRRPTALPTLLSRATCGGPVLSVTPWDRTEQEILVCLSFGEVSSKNVLEEPNPVQGGTSPRGPGLGWLGFGEFPGWWAATIATYCPSMMVEHSKSKSTQPRSARREEMPHPVDSTKRRVFPNLISIFKHSVSMIPFMANVIWFKDWPRCLVIVYQTNLSGGTFSYFQPF